MDVGDLILLQAKTWIVRKIEAGGTAFLEAANGGTALVPSNGDTLGLCTRICNPAKDWFSVMLPAKSRGRMTELWHGTRQLSPLQDWVRDNQFQMGGLLLLNPKLGLGYKDRLTAVFSVLGGKRIDHTPINIPPNFSSAAHKINKLNAPPPEPPPPPVEALYAALISEDDL